jgi:hypothetical protein
VASQAGSDLYNALRQIGFPEGAAAGIVGNWSVESGFDPNIRGDGGQARGLKQWHPDRWAHFLRWISANNVPDGPDSLHAQFGFALAEFKQEGIYDDLMHITDPVEAARLVMVKDERPGDQSDAAAKRRAAAGVEIARANGSALSKVQGWVGDVVGGAAGAAGSAASSAAGAVADSVLGAVGPILWKGLFVALGVGLLGVGAVKAFDVKVPLVNPGG